jgi:hypothetical protein
VESHPSRARQEWMTRISGTHLTRGLPGAIDPGQRRTPQRSSAAWRSLTFPRFVSICRVVDTWPNGWALCLATDRHARFRPSPEIDQPRRRCRAVGVSTLRAPSEGDFFA